MGNLPALGPADKGQPYKQLCGERYEGPKGQDILQVDMVEMDINLNFVLLIDILNFEIVFHALPDVKL